jgi:selenocysteine-specific translation elongation factor
MDHFGIGAAMRSMRSVYSLGARRSGRTTSLVESVKDGDRIVFNNPIEAERVKRLCLERNVKVECIVIDPRTPHQVMERKQAERRTIFDHSWVEKYYAISLERAEAELDMLERETSVYGAAHRETKQRALELKRWNWTE